METLVYTSTTEVRELPLLSESVDRTRQVRRAYTIVFIDIDAYWAAIKRGAPR